METELLFDERNQVIIPPGSPFDLESTIALYNGRSRVTRLLYIARVSPSLAAQALVLALDAITSSTLDTDTYEATFERYTRVILALQNGEVTDQTAREWFEQHGRGKVLKPDAAWLDQTRTKVQRTLDKLEVELKGYMTNLIKESIRMGHRDLARFQYEAGQLQEAQASYSKTREYCTTNQHTLEMCLAITELALETNNYSTVKNFVKKAQGALDASAQTANQKKAPTVALPGMVAAGATPQEQAKAKERAVTSEKLIVADGVAHMATGYFDRAARLFTSVGRETLSSSQMHFIPPADIAMYALLTGLASFTRSEVQKRILENANLRPMMDAEPHLKELASSFQENKFKQFFELLRKYEARPRLDIHLAPHLSTLVAMIRSRALLTYFSPYSVVSLDRMGKAFGFSDHELQDHLIKLIEGEHLDARIDAIDSTLIAKVKDGREEAYNSAFETGREMEKKSRAAILRMRLIQHELVVKAPKSQRGGGGGGDAQESS